MNIEKEGCKKISYRHEKNFKFTQIEKNFVSFCKKNFDYTQKIFIFLFKITTFCVIFSQKYIKIVIFLC